jgi:hypothetical protein
MEKYSFKFGTEMDDYPSLGIHKGRIVLSNEELEPAFDRVIGKIVTSCLNVILNQKAEVM